MGREGFGVCSCSYAARVSPPRRHSGCAGRPASELLAWHSVSGCAGSGQPPGQPLWSLPADRQLPSLTDSTAWPGPAGRPVCHSCPGPGRLCWAHDNLALGAVRAASEPGAAAPTPLVPPAGFRPAASSEGRAWAALVGPGRAVLYRWPMEGWVRGRCRSCGRGSAAGLPGSRTWCGTAAHPPSGFALAGRPLWVFRLTGRAGCNLTRKRLT